MDSEGQFRLNQFFTKIKEDNTRIVLEKSNKYKFDFFLDVPIGEVTNFKIDERTYVGSEEIHKINGLSIEKINLGKNFSEEEKRVFKERVTKTLGKF